MAEVEIDEVLESEPVVENGDLPAPVPAPLRSLIEQRFDKEQALKEWEYRQHVATRVRSACVAMLRPTDIVIMGDTGYLQDKGAQRLGVMLGLVYPSGAPPKAERIEYPSGEFEYRISGWVGSSVTRSSVYVVGGRSSADSFFDKFDDEGNRLPVADLDVYKSAFTNWENRAISALAGLRGLAPEDYQALGMNIEKCRSVRFQSGTKGGGGGTTVPKFGKKWEEFWGQPWSSLPEEGLRFYAENCKNTLQDESKKKWHALSKKQLESIRSAWKEKKDQSDE